MDSSGLCDGGLVVAQLRILQALSNIFQKLWQVISKFRIINAIGRGDVWISLNAVAPLFHDVVAIVDQIIAELSEKFRVSHIYH
jgi:hypothetical protein